MARTLSSHAGARGASYAAFAFVASAAAAAHGVEHFLAQEPALLLLAVLGVLATAAGAFLEKTETGDDLEPHFLFALPPPRTAASAISPAHAPNRRANDDALSGSSIAFSGTSWFPAAAGDGVTATGANGRRAIPPPPPPLALVAVAAIDPR